MGWMTADGGQRRMCAVSHGLRLKDGESRSRELNSGRNVYNRGITSESPLRHAMEDRSIRTSPWKRQAILG